MSEIYPFESHYFERDGIRLHYLDEGAGEPVVMVHGNPTWSFYYRRWVTALKDRYRVIVPDHIGCGLSDKPGDDRYPYRLERRAADLEALLDSLDVRGNITLVAHDWGGMIAMHYAVSHPDRVRRIILLNTAAFHLPANKSIPMSLRLARSPIGALLVRGMNLFSLGLLAGGIKRRRLSPEERAGYLRPYDSWQNRIAVHRFVQDIPLKPGDPSYATVSKVQDGLERLRDIPVLLFWGMKDFVFDADFLAEWDRLLPHARVVRFEDAGHLVLEDAFDEIRETSDEFLATT